MRKQDHSMRSDLISIFTPVYNDSNKRILRAFDSLKKQTWRNWEWVIYDDSDETDEGKTWAHLEKLALLDQRIKLIKGEKHSGFIGFVKHKAAMACRGYVLTELDYDDELTPTTLWVLNEAFKAYPHCHFAYTHFAERYAANPIVYHDYGDGWGKGFGGSYYERVDDHWATVLTPPEINQWSMSAIVGVPNHVRAWRRDFYREIGGHDVSLEIADDYDLILRSVQKTKFIRVPMLGYIQYFNEERDNTTFDNKKNAKIQSNSKATYKKYKKQLGATLSAHDQIKEDIDYKTYTDTYWSHPNYIPSYNETYQPDPDLISIIMPTYDRAEYLRKAIDSVKAQTYKNWELIIIGDNCPTLKNTLSGETDRRIKWWNLKQNNGPGGTVPRNYALKMVAKGHWIAYLDDDNQWESNHLSSLKGAIKEFNADYAISSFKVDGIPVICKKPRLYRVDTSTILHKAYLLKEFGFWKTREEAGYAHDWEFVSRWKSRPWAASNDPTLIYNNIFSQNQFEGIYEAYDDQLQPLSSFQS